MKIEGKVVVITGASSGIGAATAKLAHARKAKVVLAARRAERLEALAKELPGALVVPTDVTIPEQLAALVDRTVAHFGRLDVLVNNAGQGLHVPLEQVKLEDFRAITELNVFSPLVAMQAVLPVMRKQGGGAIVNISSGTSRMTLPGLGAYASTKASLNMLSQIARAEFARDGIVVSLVLPGITATEFHHKLRAGQFDASRSPYPPHSPESVAEAILEVIESGEPEVALSGFAGGPPPQRPG